MNPSFFRRSRLFLLLTAIVWSVAPGLRAQGPNVILIMADDVAYTGLGCYGSPYYETPVLDSLAAGGLLFTQAIAQPLCTPSRVKIMTGKRNYHNYDYFGYLHPDERTFGQVMQEAGYATCVVGKWQLNGLSFRLEGYQDATRPHQLGFDEYALWQLTHPRSAGERYAEPLIEQNGRVLDVGPDDYGPDLFADYLLDFIERHRDQPFFAYYPMVLVHEPFVPTPDSPEWADPGRRMERDTAYFRDMVAYTDKIVGRIADKLHALGIDDNTLLIFTSDNGTHPSVVSPMPLGTWPGAKGQTVDLGVHVPMIAYQPGAVAPGRHDGFIDFSDFFPTLADIAGRPEGSDGRSFLPLLRGEGFTPREDVIVYYDPRWGNNVNRQAGCFAQSGTYKLYQDGRFYNIAEDYHEQTPLPAERLSDAERAIHQRLNATLSTLPNWYATTP